MSLKRMPSGVLVALILVVVNPMAPRSALGQPPAFIRSWPSTGLPLGLALDANARLYMPDESVVVALRVFSQEGSPIAIFGSGAGFEGYGVAVAGDQTILVADYYGRRVQRYAQNGSLLSEWPTGGQRALFLAVDELDNVYVTDDEGDAVRKFSRQGTLLAQWSVAHPSGVAYVNGQVCVAEMFNGSVNTYTPGGAQQGAFATGCTWAEQLLFDGAGHLYLADHGLHQLKCFGTDGTLLWTMGPTVPGYPFGVADFFSVVMTQDGTLFAGDYANRNVLIFSPSPTQAAGQTFGALKSRYRGGRAPAQPAP